MEQNLIPDLESIVEDYHYSHLHCTKFITVMDELKYVNELTYKFYPDFYKKILNFEVHSSFTAAYLRYRRKGLGENLALWEMEIDMQRIYKNVCFELVYGT